MGSFDGATSADVEDGGSNDTYFKHARLSLKTWTGQETELGTLKTYTETRFNFQNNNRDAGFDPDGPGPLIGDVNPAGNGDTVSLNFAWIQLGGLRVGKDESAFDTFIGYAGNVIQDTLVPYGGFDTNVVQYYFDAGNGFSAVVSLEEGSGGGVDGSYGVGTIDSYVPHVVGGVKWTQGWGAITGVIAYDSNYEEVSGKVRLDVTVNDAISLFIMGGYGTDDNLTDPTYAFAAGGRGFYKPWDGNWAFWGGGTYKFNEKTSFNTQISYDEGENLGIAANIAYDVVPGLTITAEVDYVNAGSIDNADGLNHNWTGITDGDDAIGGMLRFQRSF
ncbi:Porin omp2b [Mesorhizobium metallidurans STM 2683]|uniref:Porin n=1 Tax=Mesorhizobium metallidurans STM 2683 TaxID=1297569 RepID=M5ENM7_9HYPH|nr:Porin omp2b [Mesorhizobium metallidurans STM 2683]